MDIIYSDIVILAWIQRQKRMSKLDKRHPPLPKEIPKSISGQYPQLSEDDRRAFQAITDIGLRIGRV